MLYSYQLVLFYNDGSEEVIKTSTAIKEIDDITVQFKDKEDICKHYCCENVTIRYFLKDEKKYLDLLFRDDKFKYASVKYEYAKYLIKNKDVLDSFLKKVSPAVRNRTDAKNSFDEKCLVIYNSSGKIDKNLLVDILASYFGREKPLYGKYRKAYLGLKKMGVKVSCYKDEVKLKESIPRKIYGFYTENDKVAAILSNYDGEDSYVDIMMYLAKNGCPIELLSSFRPVTEEEYNDKLKNDKVKLFIKKSDDDVQRRL